MKLQPQRVPIGTAKMGGVDVPVFITWEWYRSLQAAELTAAPAPAPAPSPAPAPAPAPVEDDVSPPPAVGGGGGGGTPGPPGADGKTVRNGTGAPASGLGVNGDFYIDTAATTIYGPKTGGAWGSPTSLVGPPAPGGGVYHVGASWSGGGSAVTVPTDDVAVRVHTTGTITGVYVVTSGGAGSCSIDVWRDTWASFPPTVADTIVASAKPAISSGIKYSDATLTGWTRAVTAGDVVLFHLESSSTFKTIQIFLEVTP